MRGRIYFKLLLIPILFVSFVSLANSLAITKANWLNHPEIVKIRRVYHEVETAIQTKQLQVGMKNYGYGGTGSPIYKSIYYNRKGIVRKFMESVGSEDSSLVYSYYYDSNAVQRFVFIQAGAVCGSVMEHRIYFNACGKRIWEISKYLREPEGYWPKRWPENLLIREPWPEYNKE